MAYEKRGRAEWMRLVQLWKASGHTAKVFAAEHGLAPASLYWWSRQVARGRAATRGASFIPVEITRPSGDTAIMIEVAQVRMRVPVGAAVTYVMSLLAALRQAAC